jgi:hypothetical protein
MKTAMQELIDSIRFTDKECYATMFDEGIFKIALEKEKEQIITDYSNGLIYALGYKQEDKNIEYGIVMQSKAEADIYYNENYNQTK